MERAILQKAIESVSNSEIAYSKFITPNDTGATGGHQSGFHISKSAWPIFFNQPGEKGSNKDRFVDIKWNDDFTTTSRFVYYGSGTRNEYRLTRFGKGFPFLNDDAVGSLLVLTLKDFNFNAYVLETEDEVESFFAAVNITALQTNRLIKVDNKPVLSSIDECLREVVLDHGMHFPTTYKLSQFARECYGRTIADMTDLVFRKPDRVILDWVDKEYQLFKYFENAIYSERLGYRFENVEDLVEFANSVLNRRKSRAGKSLEHHIEQIFIIRKIMYSSQSQTEINKKPDFVFPSIHCYHDLKFPENRLSMLATKTTCKDRWRQILNEADRIKVKHLFTLQPGISINQLAEMKKYGVQLIVPLELKKFYPKEFKEDIWDLNQYLHYLNSRQIG